MDTPLRVARAFCFLCVGTVPAVGLGQDEVEVPQGYEDAAMADEVDVAIDVVVEEEEPSLIDVLAGALVEEVDPNVANLQQQFLPQFRSLWTAEMAFLQRACPLNQQQRDQIDKAGEQAVRSAVRAYAVAQNQMQHGGVRIVGGRIPTMPDPRRLVQQQMARVAKGKLSAEQTIQYEEECTKRSDNRKRVAVLNLVAILDERLVLTAEQRDKLVESLLLTYQEAWGQSLEMLQHNPQFMPSIPDQHLIQVLNKTQLEVWRGTQKHGPHVFFGGMGFAQGMVVIDDGDIVLVEEEVIVEPEVIDIEPAVVAPAAGYGED